MFIFSKKKTGDLGEDIAEKYLKKKGFLILERNYQNKKGRRLGEIDIIAKKNNEIIFIEVKTRDYQKFKETLPEENITFLKLRKISKIAENYLREKKMDDFLYHFDAISVWFDFENGKAKIKHIENL